MAECLPSMCSSTFIKITCTCSDFFTVTPHLVQQLMGLIRWKAGDELPDISRQ